MRKTGAAKKLNLPIDIEPMSKTVTWPTKDFSQIEDFLTQDRALNLILKKLPVPYREVSPSLVSEN